VICRIWHGWTTPKNADRYETLLTEEILPGIESRGIVGFRGVKLLRRDLGAEVEFVTLMQFDSIDAVRDFVGDDYAVAYVPANARAVLSRFDQRAEHYEVRAATNQNHNE
jgi:hypothetical protein